MIKNVPVEGREISSLKTYFNNCRYCFSFFLLLIILLPVNVKAESNVHVENIDSDKVTLHYFWSRYCPHCLEAKPFIHSLPKTYPWLVLISYDLVGSKENQQKYVKMASSLQQTANSVPAFIFCAQMMVGYDKQETTGKELEQKLLDCHHQKNIQDSKKQQSFNVPGFGDMHYQDFSLPVFTLIIAALDAFNPCAFFILFFLLSLMVNQQSRLRMLVIGTTFVLCSGFMYFLFMSAWLNLFLLTDQLVLITVTAGVIAIVFGSLNIKDYFYYNQGLSLSLSGSARNKLFARIRTLSQSGSWPAMILATLVLAVAANSYELLCSAGLPMVYTRVLTLHGLADVQYYLYLALYNVVYMLPLLFIVLLFTVTLGRKKLSETEGRQLKFLSGSMMLGLGGILLLKPELLNNMLVSISVVLGAVGLTILLVLIEKTKYKL